MFPASLLVFVSSGWLAAQLLGPVQRGEVVGGDPKGLIEGRFLIEVVDASSHTVMDRVLVAPNGTFEFRAFASGASGLDIRLVNQRGDILRQERFLSQSASSSPLRLNLTSRQAERPSGELVSVGRLRHKPPKKALGLYRKAAKAAAEDRSEDAVRLLEEAVRVDPEFLEAYNNLGTRLLKLNRLQPAAAAFERAIGIDPADSRSCSNLAVTQLRLGLYAEAESTARHASRLQRSTRHAEYLLGLSLMAQKKDLPEALSLLERAADELPHAHMAAGQILMALGRKPESARHLELFLKTAPAGSDRELAERWLRAVAP